MQRAIRRFAFLSLLLSAACCAQESNPPQRSQRDAKEDVAWTFRAYAGPELPADRGLSGLWQDLQKLRTTARMMVTAAHPDDEPGALMTLEARGRGATVLMMALTRGEGGQNRTGGELFDELGILRTLELMAADKYYGVERRFSHAADFGFSKTADETLQKWGGHDPVLSDIVRVIREFKPDILISRFTGTTRDGHGNHQASGILTREAFRAAADPNRFPEQIREGLQPWQAKKFYVCFFGAQNASVELNTGQYSPALGESYGQFATQGLAHQLSQITPPIAAPGDRIERCEVQGGEASSAGNDLFAGIDTSLAGLASRTGADASTATALAEIDRDAQQAIAAYNASDPSKCAPPLLAGASALEKLLDRVRASSPDTAAKAQLETEVSKKLEQFRNAANEALGVELIATVDPPGGPQQPGQFFQQITTQLFATPGQSFNVTLRLYNRSPREIKTSQFGVDVPQGWTAEPLEPTQPGAAITTNQSAAARFKITAPANAEYTRPFWHRDNQEEDPLYIIDDARWATLPYMPPPVRARAGYTAEQGASEARTVVDARYVDPIYGQKQRPIAVAPALSVELDPPTNILNADGRNAAQRIDVRVANTGTAAAEGTLRLAVPSGWSTEPSSLPVKLEAGEMAGYSFNVRPANLREQHYQLRATVEANGKQFAEGFRTITREDLGALYYYRPAKQDVSAVGVKLPPNLKVGYIMGAGDDIPQVLEQLGLDITTISPQELATGDLSRYGTIVLGIRAYDVRQDVRNYNRRLLQYVENGGTLVVQYNANVGNFNAGHYAPYPATVANERVTVEEAPVEVLDPQSPLMHFPNAITSHDFDNWVQERGLYFMGQWDSHFEPLLASHDPGEQPLKGGLLVANYGKGKYVFTGYAFFRQLPAGVPGAVRLFVNLLSAGHETKP